MFIKPDMVARFYIRFISINSVYGHIGVPHFSIHRKIQKNFGISLHKQEILLDIFK